MRPFTGWRHVAKLTWNFLYMLLISRLHRQNTTAFGTLYLTMLAKINSSETARLQIYSNWARSEVDKSAILTHNIYTFLRLCVQLGRSSTSDQFLPDCKAANTRMHYPTNYLGIDLGHIRKYLTFRQLGGQSLQLGPLWLLSVGFHRQCQLSAYMWLRYMWERSKIGSANPEYPASWKNCIDL